MSRADRNFPEELLRDLAAVLNRHNVDSDTSTPDFILAEHLADCIAAYALTIRQRQAWFGVPEFPGSALLGPKEPLKVPDA